MENQYMSDLLLSEDEVYVFNLIHKYLMNIPRMMGRSIMENTTKPYLVTLFNKKCFITGLSLSERKIMFCFENKELPEISVCASHLIGSQMLKQIEDVVKQFENSVGEQL